MAAALEKTAARPANFAGDAVLARESPDLPLAPHTGVDTRSALAPDCLPLALQLAQEMRGALRSESTNNEAVADAVGSIDFESRASLGSSFGSLGGSYGHGTPVDDSASDTSSAPPSAAPALATETGLSMASLRLSTVSAASANWTSSFTGPTRPADATPMPFVPGAASAPDLTRFVMEALRDAETAAATGSLPACTPGWARHAVLSGGSSAALAPDLQKLRRRTSFSFRGRSAPGPSRSLDQVRDPSVLAAPITDILVRPKGADPADPRYYQIKTTVGGRRAMLNAGAWGKDTYLWVRKDPSWTPPAVTGLSVILPDRGEFLPPGFGVVRDAGAPLDLNEATSGERVYLCRRLGVANPLVDLQVVLLRKDEFPPVGYSLLSQTPLGYAADVNVGAGGTAVYFAYRQALFTLDPLQLDALVPLPPAPTVPAASPVPSDAGQTSLVAHPDLGTLQRLSENSPTGPAELAIDVDVDYAHAPAPRLTPSPGAMLCAGVVDSSGCVEHAGKREALSVILHGLYHRHGGVPALALERLQALLQASDFFDSGMRALPPAGTTLLEVALDAVCDQLELYQEAILDAGVTFVTEATARAKGILSPEVAQRVRGTLIGCSLFHASRVHDWVRRPASRPYRDAAGTAHRYPALAFEGLKQLARSEMAQLDAAGAEPGGRGTDEATSAPGETENGTESFVKEILEDVVDTVLDHVELARVLSSIFHVVLRSSVSDGASGGSEGGTQLHAIGRRLFTAPAPRALFALLCLHCKAAVAPLRRLGSGELVARDLALKLMGLELLGALLRDGGEQFTASNVFGYLVRRLISTVVLQNAVYCLWDLRVLQAVLNITSAVWERFRRHMRLELAVIADALLLPILRVAPGSFAVPPAQQLATLKELVSWFDNTPHHLVELFLNFDMDASARNWNVFEGLCAALCALSEADVPLPTAPDAVDEDRERQLRSLQRAALRAVSQITRALMDASGHAHLLKRDVRTRKLSMREREGGWVLEDTLVNEGDGNAIRNAREAHPVLKESSSDDKAKRKSNSGRMTRSASSLVNAVTQRWAKGPDASEADDLVDSNGLDLEKLSQDAREVEEAKSDAGTSSVEPVPKRPGHGRASSIVMRQNEQQKNREHLRQALDIYRSKSLKKAIRYLIAVNFISDTPRDIASFIRLYAYELAEEDIGDYLGEGGATEADEKYYNLIRLSFVRAISFVNMRFELALRHFLTRCGFKLPGEAQKVDRILSTFCLRYWEDNQHTSVCPFSNSDTMFVVAFAVIMLNTDLHRANSGARNRQRRMTKQEFARNLRGVDESPDLNSEFLSTMYDSIAAQPIAIGVDLTPAYLRDSPSRAEEEGPNQQRFVRSLTVRLQRDEEMLAGLELNGAQNRFLRVGVDTSLSLDLLRLMFEAVWFHFHGVVNHILEGEGVQDADAVNDGMDILLFSLSAAIFLNMETVRTAFATQLAKFRHRFGSGKGTGTGRQPVGTYFIQGEHLQEPWFQAIGLAAQEDAGEAIAKVHGLFLELKARVQENDQRRELEALARRIDPRADLLNGPRTFIKEGDLVKVCRSGKKVTYRFFLFSDKLLYTHQALVGGAFRLHEALPVGVMRVEDVPGSNQAAFHIHHPRKAFVVHAPTVEEKRIWMRVLADAIEAALQKRDMEKQLSLAPALIPSALDTKRLSAIESGDLTSPTDLGPFDLPPEVPAGPALKSLYRKAVAASVQLLEPEGASPPALDADATIAMYALFKQAEQGDCPPGEAPEKPADARKKAAWQRCEGLSTEAAQAEFIRELDARAPGWRAAANAAQTPESTPRGDAAGRLFA